MTQSPLPSFEALREAALRLPAATFLVTGPAVSLLLVGLVAALTALAARGRAPLQPGAAARPAPMPHDAFLTINIAQLCLFGTAKLYLIPRLPSVRWGAPTLWDTVVAAGAAMLMTDLLYWAWHRLLHTDLLWRRVHYVHHEVTAPGKVSDTYYEHPLEFFVGSTLTLLPLAVLPMHVAGLFLAVFLQALLGVAHHAGRDLPAALSARGHDLHHERCAGNYAQSFSLVDRLFGTAVRA
jgi:sterol desaturase/sphingolipid hydroxylase (fatty acid hydroxylase superfamily)